MSRVDGKVFSNFLRYPTGIYAGIAPHCNGHYDRFHNGWRLSKVLDLDFDPSIGIVGADLQEADMRAIYSDISAELSLGGIFRNFIGTARSVVSFDSGLDRDSGVPRHSVGNIRRAPRLGGGNASIEGSSRRRNQGEEAPNRLQKT